MLGVVGLALVVMLFFGSVGAVGSRLRGATGETRMRLLWLIWGAVAVPLGLMLAWANHFLLGDHDWLTDAALLAVSVALPTTIAVAILRHQLLTSGWCSRTLTYGVLVVGVVALYALLLLAAEQMGGSGTAGGLLAVAVVAVTVHPAYSWLRRRIERFVYGYRSEPYRALRLLADRTEAAGPEGLGASITEVVAEALRVDQVWVDTSGAAGDDRVVRVPLVHRGESLGDLVVEVPPGRQLSASDLSLLHDLARSRRPCPRRSRGASP